MKNYVKKSLLVFLSSILLVITILSNYNVSSAATIKINKSKLTLYEGKTDTLKITGTTKAVKWTTNKKSVATVSSTGVVSAKSVGNAIITATVNKKKYTCNVTVDKIHINRDKLDVNLSEAQARDSFAGCLVILGIGDSNIEWSSSDISVATIDNEGFVYAYNIGTAIITGKSGNKTFTCTVTVTDYSDAEKMAAYGLILLDEFLKDPSSITINNIYHTKTDKTSDKQEVVVIDYTATNGLGGRVRNYASIMIATEIFNFGYTLESDDLGYIFITISDSKPVSATSESLSVDNVLEVKTFKKQKSYTIHY